MNRERIIALSELVPTGRWTTYKTLGQIVYGHDRGGQAVGIVMRGQASASSAHRVLRSGGKVSEQWQDVGGGPEECIRRLRVEGTWDERRARAHPDRYMDAAELRLREP